MGLKLEQFTPDISDARNWHSVSRHERAIVHQREMNDASGE